jgi:HD-GYP domain-containing protein (c-di-GMP phosphodiesterase class II)
MILLALEDVRPGMLLGRTIYNREGHTLLGAGMPLSPQYIGRLQELGYWAVWIEDEDTRDIVYRDAVTDATRLATTSAVQTAFVQTARQMRTLRTASVQKVRETLDSGQFQQAFRNLPVLTSLRGRVDTMVQEVLDSTVLHGLGALQSHDSYTYDHSMDVAVTATMIGRLVGYDPETLKKLAVGCLLHDIGRIFVDDTILAKPTALTREEKERVREHTALGYLFLRDSLKVGVLSAHVAYQHHERVDGAGYPRGLAGSNRIVRGLEAQVPGRINPFGEIAAIANEHSSLSSHRPHRRALPPDQVWRLIKAGAGTAFNAEMVELFLAVLPPYPVGTQVAVTSGQWQDHRGVVVSARKESMARPVIRLLADAADRRLDPPLDVDLSSERDVAIRGILGRGVEGHSEAPAAEASAAPAG